MRNLPTRIRKWATSLGRSEPEPEPTQTIEELRRTTATAVVAMDDAIRASARELETARTQVGTHACERFARTLESARALPTRPWLGTARPPPSPGATPPTPPPSASS